MSNASSKPARRASGKGAKAAEQGMVTIRSVVDRPSMDRLRLQAASRPTVFPKVDDSAFDIEEEEIAFTHKITRNDVLEDKNSLHIQTSLNCMGAEILDAYPNDQQMQVAAMENRIKFAGIARDSVSYASRDKRQGLALQVAGICSPYIRNDCPPGAFAQLYVPTKQEVQSAETIRRPYLTPGKVTLELRPHNPRTIETKVRAVLRSYVSNPDTFKKAMNERYRTTHVWVNFVEALFHSYLTAWAVITSTLVKSEVISPVTFTARADRALGKNIVNPALPAPGSDEVILGIMTALGALPKTKPDGSSIDNAAGVNTIQITEAQRALYQGVRRTLQGSVFLDPSHEQLMFAYDLATNVNRAKNDADGRLKLSTPIGNLVYNQINHTTQAVSAMSDAVRRDQELVIGKIVGGASAGGRADVML
jgi:hypothetical protein